MYILEPLGVDNLSSEYDDESGSISISWSPNPTSVQESYLVSYHEVESSIGDSNTIPTNKTKIILEALLPGRNYSITVQAASKDQLSVENVIYVVTKPSAPIIEDLKPIVDGLNISWKSDVNSKQDKYEVQWIRNDTDDKNIRTTYDSKIILNHLYPGGGYLVKVFAISHELKSEPHEYFQPVCKSVFCYMYFFYIPESLKYIKFLFCDLCVKYLQLRILSISLHKWILFSDK